MAVEQHIAKGDACLAAKDWLGAIAAFTSAIKENPSAFQAYIKRSTAYSKCSNEDAAKKDISQAFTIANERGKRADMGLCHFKLGLISYKEKEIEQAKVNFERAVEFGCTEPTLQMWKTKTEYEWKKENKSETSEPKELDSSHQKEELKEKTTSPTETNTKSDPSSTTNTIPSSKSNTTTSSSNIDTINKHAPLTQKIRDDWYQSSDEVIITIYAKDINEKSVDIQFASLSVLVLFPTASGSEYNYDMDPLFSTIDPEKSSYKVYRTKLEVTLVKTSNIKWSTLEQTDTDVVPTKMDNSENPGLTYPSSSKKAINWDKFNIKDDEEESGNENEFFAKLYKDVDDDTRRAMMKSYVESNGTVLTTNWAEAKDKKFETSPPQGMEAKKWNK